MRVGLTGYAALALAIGVRKALVAEGLPNQIRIDIVHLRDHCSTEDTAKLRVESFDEFYCLHGRGRDGNGTLDVRIHELVPAA